ncbi:MAG: ATP-binding protein [Minisyncoccia bacterium]
MKLRIKLFVFFGIFLSAIALGIFFYAEYAIGSVFKKQALGNIRIIAEQSESAYLSFLGSMKVRIIDWTSDNTIRETAKKVLASPKNSSERARLSEEFSRYIRTKKMPFDKTIFLADLLDKDGVIIASTRPERIGKNEMEEKQAERRVHNLKSAINSEFGEVFFGSIVLGEDGNADPTISVTAKLFDINESDGKPVPIDALLHVYFSNMENIADVLGSGTNIYSGLSSVTGRNTSRALLETYKTLDIYIVNSEQYLVTPTRAIKGINAKQKVSTLPVRECLDNGKEINEEYIDYRGISVLGASMCFQEEGTVLILTIDKAEVFAPMTTLIQSTIVGVSIAFLIGLVIISIFIRPILANIDNVVLVAKKVAKGDLNVSTKVGTKDELGYLATSFNTMIASVRDTEKALRASKYKIEEEKAKDEALLASLGEGVVAIDKSGNIIMMNRMAEEMLGVKSIDVIGKRAINVIRASDENGNIISPEQRVLSEDAVGTTVTLNTLYYQKGDGTFFPVSVTVTPVTFSNEIIGSISIFRDITKEKEIEKTRTDLLSLASHQLRTPLSGTKWLIETLKKGIHGPLTAPQTDYLNELYKINERMTGLVHDMLGVLRIEGDSSVAKKEDISIKSLLTTVSETLYSSAESKQIKIQVPNEINNTISTDPLLLRSIIECLVSNAINYSENGSEINIEVEQKNTEVVFAIKDSGIGIPKGEQRQIFERFYRASNAKTFDTHGSGLGLYIASMLAKKIGAKITFESESGKGSTFYVHVPTGTINKG